MVGKVCHYCEPNLLAFFLCFVGGIFIFANFPSGSAKFLGFVGFLLWISLLGLGIRLDGRKMLLLFLFISWFSLLIFGFSLGAFRLALKWHDRTGPEGMGLGVNIKPVY